MNRALISFLPVNIAKCTSSKRHNSSAQNSTIFTNCIVNWNLKTYIKIKKKMTKYAAI